MLHVETRGRVLVLTLDRPEARNAINAETTAAIVDALDRFEADPELWVAMRDEADARRLHTARVLAGRTGVV